MSNLRLDLLDAAENCPACVAAVQSACAVLDTGGARATEDVERLLAECVLYLTDPVRACGCPLAVGLFTAASLHVLAVADWWQDVLHCARNPR